MRKREVRVWGSGGSAGPGSDSVPRVSPQWMRRWVYTSVGVTPVSGASGSRWSVQEPDPAARALGSSGRGRARQRRSRPQTPGQQAPCSSCGTGSREALGRLPLPPPEPALATASALTPAASRSPRRNTPLHTASSGRSLLPGTRGGRGPEQRADRVHLPHKWVPAIVPGDFCLRPSGWSHVTWLILAAREV